MRHSAIVHVIITMTSSVLMIPCLLHSQCVAGYGPADGDQGLGVPSQLVRGHRILT